jgi:hypothetical protein
MVRTILTKGIGYSGLLLLCFCAVSVAQTKFKTYTNQRFFFTVDYPSTFRMSPPDFDGDGRIFTSQDKKVEIRAWGGYNALFHTLKEEFDFEAKDLGAQITYQHMGKNWFVISGICNGKIIYQKTLLRKERDVDIFYTLRIEYPAANRNEYDPIIGHIQHSLRWILGSDV